ncbi:MAG: hypothetical protein KBS66_03990 [Eubacterium sp.]|nr:hypothetical protein [Candidatus Colimonas fimequi]
MEKLSELNEMQLARFPDCKLYHTIKAGKEKYFKVPKGDNVTSKININSNPQEIELLKEKLYLETQGKLIDENLLLLNNFMSGYVELTPQNIIGAMSKHDQKLNFDQAIQNLQGRLDTKLFSEDEVYINQNFIITPQMRSRIDSHKGWANSPYHKSDFRPQDLTKITSRNEAMRTKAEVMFAEMLYKYEIPFQYERVLPFGDLDYAPDFTFEEATKELLRVEYCGMMDRPDYVRKHLIRLKNYAKLGVIPGVNLICVYNQNNEINMQEVESVIRYQIIPRL